HDHSSPSGGGRDRILFYPRRSDWSAWPMAVRSSLHHFTSWRRCAGRRTGTQLCPSSPPANSPNDLEKQHCYRRQFKWTTKDVRNRGPIFGRGDTKWRRYRVLYSCPVKTGAKRERLTDFIRWPFSTAKEHSLSAWASGAAFALNV